MSRCLTAIAALCLLGSCGGGRVTIYCPPCGTDELCVLGDCFTFECGSDADCPDGLPYCREGGCSATECLTNDDCPSGLVCDVTSCVPTECDVDADCGELLVCRNRLCASAFELFTPVHVGPPASCPAVTTNAVAWTEFGAPDGSPPRLIVDGLSGGDLSFEEPAGPSVLGIGVALNQTHLWTGNDSLFRVDVEAGLLELVGTLPEKGNVYFVPGILAILSEDPPYPVAVYRTSPSGIFPLLIMDNPGDGPRDVTPRGACFIGDGFLHAYDFVAGLSSFYPQSWPEFILGCNDQGVFTVFIEPVVGPVAIREYSWDGSQMVEHPPVFFPPTEQISVGSRFLLGVCASDDGAMCAYEPATGRTYYAGPRPEGLWCPNTYGDIVAWLDRCSYFACNDTGSERDQIHFGRFIGGD